MLHFHVQWDPSLPHSRGAQATDFWLIVNHSYAAPIRWRAASQLVALPSSSLPYPTYPVGILHPPLGHQFRIGIKIAGISFRKGFLKILLYIELVFKNPF